MEFRNIFAFDIKWSYRTISLFVFLLVLPNFLGMINLTTPWGFKLHFFQLAVFIAALVYGPSGGLLSGAAGSVFSAVMMHNPYLIIGNAILGFFAGLFSRMGFNAAIAVMAAFLIQIPWLILTDYYLVSLPSAFIKPLVIALAASNLIWAVLAGYISKPVKNSLKC